MLTLETLTLKDLQPDVTQGGIKKAREYQERLRNLTRRGQTLQAEVTGSRIYQVEIDVEPGGVHAACSCPYDWSGYCKHITAVLLKWLTAPKEFVVQTAVSPPTTELETIPVSSPKTHRPKEQPNWIIHPFAARQQEAQQTLIAWLNVYRLQDLRTIASQRGWKLKGTNKTAVAEQLQQTLQDPVATHHSIASLSDNHKHVLWALVLRGARAYQDTQIIEKIARLWGFDGNINDILYDLYDKGFVLSNTENSPHAIPFSTIPNQIIPGYLSAMADILPVLPDPPPHSHMLLASPLAFVRTTLQLLLLLGQSTPPLRLPQPRPRLEKFYSSLKEWDYVTEEVETLKINNPFKSSSELHLTVPPPLRALPDEVIGRFSAVAGGEAKLEFFYHLLLATGLIQPGSPVTVWQEVKTAFMSCSESKQWAVLTQAYFGLVTWSEVWEYIRATPELAVKRVGQTHYFKPIHLQTTLLNMRQVVLRVLACLPENEWIAFDVFCYLMRAVWPKVETVPLPGHYLAANVWFFSKNGRSLDPTAPASWDLVQGEFIYQILTGPLHWLGLADVCLDDKKIVAFQLHGLANLYWDMVEVPTLPETAVSPTVTPAPTLTAEGHRLLINPTTLSAPAHTFLGKICQLKETTPQQFVYQLDIHAVHTVFEAGTTLSQLQEEWQTALATPIPPSFADALAAWWQGYGQVRLYENASLIELGDDYALTEMKSITSLNKFLIAEISPRLVLIPESAIPVLTAELEKAGYTPKKEEG